MRLIHGKSCDLGDGFEVSRVLPQIGCHTIGPFVFFDHIGPVDFAPGKGIEVRPHPHIGLATITYLFEGRQMHRDSLGSVQEITPGDVNWMMAGRGIVHSERVSPEIQASGQRMHGIQSWVGVPTAFEEANPSFQYFPSAGLPRHEFGGVTMRLVAGKTLGLASPVQVCSDLVYADLTFAAGARFVVPDEYPERALFVTDGSLDVNGIPCEAGAMAVFEAGEKVTAKATAPARAMLLGGAPLDGPRHVWWNFVSSSKERIELAKADWRAQKMGRIAGDDSFIPLPD